MKSSGLNKTLQISRIIENNRYILFFNRIQKFEIISKIRARRANFEAIKNNKKVYFSNLFLILFFLKQNASVNKNEINKK